MNTRREYLRTLFAATCVGACVGLLLLHLQLGFANGLVVATGLPAAITLGVVLPFGARKGWWS